MPLGTYPAIISTLAILFLPAAGAGSGSDMDEARSTFSTEKIEELVAENHPAVRLAEAAVKAAKARVLSASALPNPELEGKLLVDPSVPGGIPGGEGELKFPIPLSGRVGLRESQARLELRKSKADLESARRLAHAEARKLLRELSIARAKATLLESLAEDSKKYSCLAEARRESEVSDPLDVALVLAEAARDRAAGARIKAYISSLEDKIKFLAALPFDAVIEIPGPPVKVELRQPLDYLVKRTVETSPLMKSARLNLAAAKAGVEASRAERFPDLLLGPAVEGEAGHTVVGLFAGVELPLFNTRQGDYENALTYRLKAAYKVITQERDLVSHVRKLFATQKSIEHELELLGGGALDSAARAMRLARSRYKAGDLDVLRLLSVHRAYSALKLEYLDLLVEQAGVLAELSMLTGITF